MAYLFTYVVIWLKAYYNKEMVALRRRDLKAMQDDRRILMNKGINVYLRELEKEEKPVMENSYYNRVEDLWKRKLISKRRLGIRIDRFNDFFG